MGRVSADQQLIELAQAAEIDRLRAELAAAASTAARSTLVIDELHRQRIKETLAHNLAFARAQKAETRLAAVIALCDEYWKSETRPTGASFAYWVRAAATGEGAG